MYCHLESRRRSANPRPIIISHGRFNRILTNATNIGQLEKQRRQEEEQLYQSQLKAGGEALLQLFDATNVCRTQAHRIAELKMQKAEKQQKTMDNNEAVAKEEAEEQARVRKARLIKAQLLMEQLRPGPRELESAELQCEVLHAMNAQRELQRQFSENARQQRELDNKEETERTMNGIKAGQEEQRKRRQAANQYQIELLQDIEARKNLRAREQEQDMRSVKEARTVCDSELAAFKAKEREACERKRKEIRHNALEAMCMTEERRKRLTMLSEVEQSKCEEYNAAKTQLERLKANQAKQRIAKRIQGNEQLAIAVAPRLHYSATQDNARHEHELNIMRAAFSAEEKKRHARITAAKQDRIEAHLQEESEAKTAHILAESQKRADVARRLENDAIYYKFETAKRQAQLKRVQELRQKLDEQVQARIAEQAKPEFNYNQNAHLECLKEHKFFFDYAQQLMTKAKKHGCPLLPFIRAVDQYKRMHNIGGETKTPRHLVSKLTVGLRTAGDSQADAEHATEKTKTLNHDQNVTTTEESKMAGILENIKNIQKITKNE